jgi:hypothetical protein
MLFLSGLVIYKCVVYYQGLSIVCFVSLNFTYLAVKLKLLELSSISNHQQKKILYSI